MSRFPRRLSVPAILLLAAQAAFAAEPPARAIEFRYRFRRGDSWRERVVHQVEVRDEKGEVVSSRRTERTEVVQVVSVDAKGDAKLRRRPEPAGPAGKSAPEEPFEYRMTAEGVLHGAHVFSRFAPVLPSVPLAPGESSNRTTGLALGGGTFLSTTETATLAGAERIEGREIARLSLRRRPGRDASVRLLDALRAPKKDAWLAVTEPARVRLEVTGLAGEGELLFDGLAGKLVSYRMLETSGIDATLVTHPEGQPASETIHWTVTVRSEVERVD